MSQPALAMRIIIKNRMIENRPAFLLRTPIHAKSYLSLFCLQMTAINNKAPLMLKDQIKTSTDQNTTNPFCQSRSETTVARVKIDIHSNIDGQV